MIRMRSEFARPKYDRSAGYWRAPFRWFTQVRSWDLPDHASTPSMTNATPKRTREVFLDRPGQFRGSG